MKTTILVVDDSDDNRDILKEYLEESGFAVIESSDGVEALEKLKKRSDNISIVITDIRMPRMDGKELIKNIRKEYKTIGIIAITLYPSIYHEDDYRKLGADDYIVKPFEFDDIILKIEKLLFQIDNLQTKK
ncbi:response regulator [candidate division KSB1 bacterium]